MKYERKVTVMLPEELIRSALKATGRELTPTLRMGLDLIAAKPAYKGLLRLKGKLNLGLDYPSVKKDRE